MLDKNNINEELCGPLWKYIQDDAITDVKWNGKDLWIDDLNKGRYISEEKLTNDFVDVFCSKIANMNKVNFNIAYPSLMAETKELRIQAQHSSVNGDGFTTVAIRKTPTVARLNDKDLVEEDYMNKLTSLLLPCLVRARLSGIITGDVGSGKTELVKYLAQFIPSKDGIWTVEDTLELKLEKLYPLKDIVAIKIDNRTYPQEKAIEDSLRNNIKWLILAESRGRDILKIVEGASTGCHTLTTIHAENTWEVPDRVMNMIGENARYGLMNDVYTFFSYAVKVKHVIKNYGIERKIDQVTFFTRENGQNKATVFIKDGELTSEALPEQIINKIKQAKLDLRNTDDENSTEDDFLKAYFEQFISAEDMNTEENDFKAELANEEGEGLNEQL